MPASSARPSDRQTSGLCDLDCFLGRLPHGWDSPWVGLPAGAPVPVGWAARCLPAAAGIAHRQADAALQGPTVPTRASAEQRRHQLQAMIEAETRREREREGLLAQVPEGPDRQRLLALVMVERQQAADAMAGLTAA